MNADGETALSRQVPEMNSQEQMPHYYKYYLKY